MELKQNELNDRSQRYKKISKNSWSYAKKGESEDFTQIYEDIKKDSSWASKERKNRMESGTKYHSFIKRNIYHFTKCLFIGSKSRTLDCNKE